MPRFLVAGYGPSLLASFGYGAVIPMLAIQARSLGASVGLAALIAALTGIGQVVGDLPAGVLAARFGERRALAGACLIDGVALLAVFFVHNLWVFALLVLVDGLMGSVFGLARQTFLTVVVPIKWRARAMSSLGGIFRVGGFLGPLAGAAITHQHGLPAAFLLAGCMSLSAAVVTLFMPDVPTDQPPTSTAAASPGGPGITIWSVLYAHRRTLLTIGWGALSVMLVRAARQVYIPLWCNAHGISPAATNLIYAASMAAEVLLFFPGGIIMDRLGRWWVTVPTIAAMASFFAILPLSHTAWTIAAFSFLLGVGNGLSSGTVMTLGADISPPVGRAQFLAGWRVFCDIGSAIGPLVISVVAALASLAAAAWVLAAIGWAGAFHLGHMLPRRGHLPPSQPLP